MNEVQTPALTLEEQREQLDKVLRSDVFKAARGLQRFLEYVGAKTLAGLSDEVKEYAIGTEVFGRPADYDPRIDTVVRVQALRLREKLREYFEGEGAADEILLAVPKGHYVPYFTRRTSPATIDFANFSSSAPHAATSADLSAVPTLTLPEATSRTGSPSRATLLGVGAVAVLFLAIGFLLARTQSARFPWEHSSVEPSKARSAEVDPAVGLWTGFLKNDSSPMVAYCNDVFLKTESSDLLRVKSAEVGTLGATANTELASSLSTNPRLLTQAGPVSFDDTYTGTGEVMGVYYLTQMFGQARAVLRVKRSRLVTTDDLSHHDLIFLGSTRENALLAGLPLVQDFVFDWPPSAGMWKGMIKNLHPQPGEASAYRIERDVKTHVLRADYALISFLPGIAPNRKIVVLAGMTTLGTQAAAEFATSQAGMAELQKHLSGKVGDKLPAFFQALLKVDVMRGEILNVSYVTGHAIRPSQPVVQKN